MGTDPAAMIARNARRIEDPKERAEFLDRLCGGIVRLRQDVERLLAEGEPDEPAVATPVEVAPPPSRVPAVEEAPAGGGAEAGGAAWTERAGDRIGRYRLVRELGEGGFGTVWLAEQLEPVKRQVALKIIKLGMDTVQVVTRFEQERQALALMDHPNVARVLDAGATASGRPYFVMDLVQGRPIHEYCDRERLTIDQRLALFADVCAAVQHAHMKGIIHRDLKPSNVLVSTRDGKPHATVIDFGIAKATSSKLTDRSLVTEQYQVIGTLQYMSPEQAQASPDIDTRTDVYSLGVMLYELLAGSTPFDQATLERAALDEIQRMIREEEPPRPSARLTRSLDTVGALAASRGVEPARLGALVRGELDWIVMRSIEKDRARRYDTAEGLAADIRRYLAGEAVLAAPPSAAYRLRKLVRRHKGAVAAGATVAVALLVGVIGFAWQANVAQGERDVAIRAREAEAIERKRAEDVAGFMESVFRGIDPGEEEAVAGSFKDQMVARLDGLGEDLKTFSGDPVVRSRLEQAVGQAYLGLEENPKAEALLRAAYEERRASAGESDPATLATGMDLATAWARLGRFDDAIALAESVRARQVARPGTSEDELTRLDYAVGMMYAHADRADRAIEIFEATRSRRAGRPGPDKPLDLQVLHALGAEYRTTGRTEEAVVLLRDVRARRTALLGPNHSDTLWTSNSLSVALLAAGQFDEASTILKDTHSRLLQRYAPDHPVVVTAEMNLAGALGAAGKVDEEIRMVESARDRTVAKSGPDSAESLRATWGVASVYLRAGRTADAVGLLERIHEPLARMYGTGHPIVTVIRGALAKAYLGAGDKERALALLESEVTRSAKAYGEEDRRTLALRSEGAALQIDVGDPARAVELLQRVLDLQTKALGDGHRDTLLTRTSLGRAHFALGQAKPAIAALEPAFRLSTERLGADGEETLTAEALLGAAYWLDRRFDRSVPTLQDALRRAERKYGVADERTIGVAANLAASYRDLPDDGAFIDLLAAWMPRILKSRGTRDSFAMELATKFLEASEAAGRRAESVATLEILRADTLARSGPDHEETLNVASTLAAAYWSAGKLDRSVPLLEDVVPRMRRVFGEDDLATLVATVNLAVNLRDAGRAREAIPIFESAMGGLVAVGAPGADMLATLVREYVAALLMDGRREQAGKVVQREVAAARSRLADGSAELAALLVSHAVVLLGGGASTEAESLLRECISIREKASPDAWNLWNVRALLGEALLGQRRFAEAEPLVVSGYEGLLERKDAIPAQGRLWLEKGRERVLRLYRDWDAAEPGKGHDAKLAEWRAKPPASPAAKPAPAGSR